MGSCADLPIRSTQPKIRNRNGGIAQLVERQLCKLEVRGSNPLASSLRSRRRQKRRLSRRSCGVGGHFFGLRRRSRELRPGKPVMNKFFYVYILQSEAVPHRFYTGLTDNLEKRLKDHNSGRVLHTSKMETVVLENLHCTFGPCSYGSA